MKSFLNCFPSAIVGKSFEYWKNLLNKGVIDKHVIHLRLVHLKYAVDQNLISSDEYYAHCLCFTNEFSPFSTEYKSCTLMDFGKALSAQGLANTLEINQPLDRHSEKIIEEQNSVANTFGKAGQQNETTVNLNEYHGNSDKGRENNNQIRILKKSKRKRKMKRKQFNYTNINSNSCNTEIKDCVGDNCYSQIGNSTKQIVTSKNSVKIFVRPVNKKYQSAKNVNQKPLNISSKKSVREIFSKILKQFKEENKLQH